MAMNNWGGVKEHMTKKPRRFLSSRKVGRGFGGDAVRLSGAEMEVAERRRKVKIKKELGVYLLVFVLGGVLILIFA